MSSSSSFFFSFLFLIQLLALLINEYILSYQCGPFFAAELPANSFVVSLLGYGAQFAEECVPCSLISLARPRQSGRFAA